MILKVTDILMDLTKCISKKRLCHSIGVMQTAYKLAEVHGVDKDAAIIAGILHDYAKEFEHKDMIKLCKENDIKLSDHELKYPNLIHGKAASCIAKNKYGINDEDILHKHQNLCFSLPAYRLLHHLKLYRDHIALPESFDC